MRIQAACLSLLLAALPARAVPVQDALQRSAAAYREGRLMDALREAVAALEAEPESGQAKNYVFTIGEAIRKERKDATLRPGEKRRASRAARAYLAERRRRSERVLAELHQAYARSGDLRSPAGVFAALSDLDRSLGTLPTGGYDGKAQVYFANILENLEKALKSSSFSEASDRFRAEGYLAYYKGDLKAATALWEKALREAPGDPQIRADLDAVRERTRAEAKRKEVEEYVSRAEASYDAGLYADAVEAWREVLRRDPKRPGAAEAVTAAKVALEKSIDRRKIDGLMAEASGEYKAGRFSRAAEIWLDVLQVDPAYQSARVWLKLVGRKLEEETRATALPPSSAPAPKPAAAGPASAPAAGAERGAVEAEDLYHRGLIAYSSGDTAAAVDLLTRALARNPQFRRARQALEQCQTELSLTRN